MKNSHIILVFYDISATAKEYRHFRNNLSKLGYYPIQKSVYGCKIYEKDVVNQHIRSIEKLLPSNSNIRILTVTKEQFSSMEFLGEQETLYENFLVNDEIIVNF